MPTKFDVLVAAKAIEKKIAKRVKALEIECKEEFMDSYRTSGIDRMRSTVFDPKAAYMTLKGGKPSEKVTRFQLNNHDAAIDWMDETRPETDSFATENLEQFCKWWFERTGECPDGCVIFTYDSEPTEPTPMFVVKEDKVLPTLEENPTLLSEARVLMLEEGEV